MSDSLSDLIGLKCSEVKIVYFMNIYLGFGEVKIEIGRKGIRTRWSWEIFSWMGIWRITKANKTIFGSGSKESIIKVRLPSLLGLKIENVDCENFKGDLIVQMSNDTQLEILRISADEDDDWCVKGPNTWFPTNTGFADKVEDDELLSEYSELCFKRWSKQLPMEAKDWCCEECAYYCRLEGAAYFWDFGLCTNAESEYDGRVVNVGSFCPYFSESLSF